MPVHFHAAGYPNDEESINPPPYITFTACSNQALSVPLMHAKRKIINGGSGLSESRNYPHKDKRVTMHLVRHSDASALACIVSPTPSASSINER